MRWGAGLQKTHPRPDWRRLAIPAAPLLRSLRAASRPARRLQRRLHIRHAAPVVICVAKPRVALPRRQQALHRRSVLPQAQQRFHLPGRGRRGWPSQQALAQGWAAAGAPAGLPAANDASCSLNPLPHPCWPPRTWRMAAVVKVGGAHAAAAAASSSAPSASPSSSRTPLRLDSSRCRPEGACGAAGGGGEPSRGRQRCRGANGGGAASSGSPQPAAGCGETQRRASPSSSTRQPADLQLQADGVQVEGLAQVARPRRRVAREAKLRGFQQRSIHLGAAHVSQHVCRALHRGHCDGRGAAQRQLSACAPGPLKQRQRVMGSSARDGADRSAQPWKRGRVEAARSLQGPHRVAALAARCRRLG